MKLLTEVEITVWHHDKVDVTFWRREWGPKKFYAISEDSAVALYTALRGCTMARTEFDGDQMIVTVRI